MIRFFRSEYNRNLIFRKEKKRPIALLDYLAQDFELPCETNTNGNKSKRIKIARKVVGNKDNHAVRRSRVQLFFFLMEVPCATMNT